MESNWAVEHLQVIRTLMERSALYRRALAPIMAYNGAVGVIAAGVGWALHIGAPRAFILFWAVVCAVAMAGSFLLVRRQALKESEPFWSPPTRRVTQAFLPPLVAGLPRLRNRRRPALALLRQRGERQRLRRRLPSPPSLPRGRRLPNPRLRQQRLRSNPNHGPVRCWTKSTSSFLALSVRR